MRYLGILLAALVTMLGTCAANAALIASFDVDGGGGTSSVISDIDDIELAYEIYPNPDVSISTSGLLEPADIGQSFDLGGSDLVDFISLLTNGVDDTLHVYGTGNPESQWFDGNSNLTGPDLVGFNVGRIAVVLNDLTLNSPGSDPNGDGQWTDYAYDLTFNFYTAVPEPTTLALLGLGGVALLSRKRRHV